MLVADPTHGDRRGQVGKWRRLSSGRSVAAVAAIRGAKL
jgi:hypothetical protein